MSGGLGWLSNLTGVVTLRASRPENRASASFSWGDPPFNKMGWYVAEKKNTNSLEPVVTGHLVREERWDRGAEH